jgi:hypothetical protein
MDARIALLAALLAAAPAAAFDPSHAAWSTMLRKHVVVLDGGKASRLDYAGAARDRAALRAYLGDLSRVGQAEFDA